MEREGRTERWWQHSGSPAGTRLAQASTREKASESLPVCLAAPPLPPLPPSISLHVAPGEEKGPLGELHV